MDIGEKIDLLYTMRARRIDLDREVKELKAQEDTFKQDLIAELNTIQLTGAKGQVATASITHKVKSSVTDWDQVYAYILANNMPELLQKRITEGLWTALQEDGVLVPGTEPFVVVDISLTRSTRS